MAEKPPAGDKKTHVCGTCRVERKVRPGKKESFLNSDDAGNVFMWAKGITLLYYYYEPEASTNLPKGFTAEKAKAEAIRLIALAQNLWGSSAPVRIEPTATELDASFFVQFRPDQSAEGADGGNYEAEAFFPDENFRGKWLKLFPYLWDSGKSEEYIVNTLAHELGHIYGLRHSFSAEDGSEQSMVLFKRRPTKRSIMAYGDDRAMDPTDLEDLRDAYKAAWADAAALSKELMSIPNFSVVDDSKPKVVLLKPE